jgi:hypothetical protein
MKLQVGQTVYVECFGRNSFLPTKGEVEETKVTKVGKKYFEVEGKKYSKFHLDKMFNVSNYSPCMYVYLSMQEIKDKKEKQELKQLIREMIGGITADRLSLSQLLEIKNIIENPLEVK